MHRTHAAPRRRAPAVVVPELRPGLRFELFYALASLFDRTARVHPAWRARARARLPRRFWEDARVLGPARELWIALPAALPHDEPLDDWDSLSRSLDRANPHELVSVVLKGLLHRGALVDDMLRTGSVVGALRKAPRVERAWLRTLGLVPFRRRAPLAAALEVIVRDPAAAVAAMRRIVRGFWEHDFASTFGEARSRYVSSARALGEYWSTTSLRDLFADSPLRLRLEGESLVAAEGGYRVRLADIERLVVMPSAFNERRYWSAVPGARGTLVYLPWFVPSLALATAPDAALETRPLLSAFHALADASRLKMVRELHRAAARTASELAASCGLGKATVSHHVRVLCDAGLVVRAPRRSTIALSLNRDALATLGQRVLSE